MLGLLFTILQKLANTEEELIAAEYLTLTSEQAEEPTSIWGRI
jgi:hypothetical protein